MKDKHDHAVLYTHNKPSSSFINTYIVQNYITLCIIHLLLHFPKIYTHYVILSSPNYKHTT